MYTGYRTGIRIHVSHTLIGIDIFIMSNCTSEYKRIYVCKIMKYTKFTFL